MAAFAETPQCRMTALIRHFGDTADAARPCGHCDVCAPSATTATRSAAPAADEERDLRAILRALDGGTFKATGRLFTELALRGDRKHFDALLDGLVRAGLVGLTAETFVNPEGKQIPYKKASLTFEGQTLAPGAPLGVLLREQQESTAGTSRAKRSDSPARSDKRQPAEPTIPYTPAEHALAENLRAFRKAEAAKTGKPAFIVFGDAALDALVRARPQTLSAVLQVSGFGPDKVDRYGAALVALCRNEAPRPEVPPARPVQAPRPERSRKQQSEPPQERVLELDAPMASRPRTLASRAARSSSRTKPAIPTNRSSSAVSAPGAPPNPKRWVSPSSSSSAPPPCAPSSCGNLGPNQ